MSSTNVRNKLEECQLKISEYAVAEAKAKKEKAEVELDTAKLNHEYVCRMLEEQALSSFKEVTPNDEGGLIS